MSLYLTVMPLELVLLDLELTRRCFEATYLLLKVVSMFLRHEVGWHLLELQVY